MEINFDDKFYKDILDTLANPIFVKDKNHNWILLNDAFCKFMGKERSELIGKSDYDFFPKSEADVFWDKDEEVFNDEIENINEENFTDSMGITHVIMTKKTIYHDKKNEKILVGIISDITDRKLAEKKILDSEQKFEAIFKYSPASTNLTSFSTGKFVDVNDAFLKLTGFERSEVIGKSSLEISLWQNPEDRKIIIEGLTKNGYSPKVEARWQKKSGEIIDVLVEAYLIDMSKEKYMLGLVEDITERKKSENNLLIKNKELEKINRIMVDRELKMVELKKQIKKNEN